MFDLSFNTAASNDRERDLKIMSDSDNDDELLAWIDQFPILELNEEILGYLQRGAAESVPECIVGEDNVEAHARTALTQVLGISSRNDVHSIRSVHDAMDFISRQQLVLEEAANSNFGRTRSGREREAKRRSKMSPEKRAQVHDQDRLGHAARRAHMLPEQHAQAKEAHRLGEAARRASICPRPNVHK